MTGPFWLNSLPPPSRLIANSACFSDANEAVVVFHNHPDSLHHKNARPSGGAAIVAQPGHRQRRPRSAAKQLLQSYLFGLAGLIHFIHYSFLNIDIRYPDHCPGCAYPPRTNHNSRTTVATKIATGNNHSIFSY